MKVGMLRKKNKPTKIARATALACQLYGIEFFYFRPKDVDVENKVIRGSFPAKNGWNIKETSYPDVIDNSLPTKETQELYNELEKHCYFTTRRLGTKDKIYKLMKKDGGFDDLLIPHTNLKSIRHINDYIEKYEHIILKPSKGSQGNSIYQLCKENGLYKLDTNKSSQLLSEEEIKRMIADQFKKRKYLIQPFISSRMKEGHPFDIRIHVRRAQNGEWKIVTYLPRIGVGNAITSNVNQGGGISQVDPFLQHVFGDDFERVKASLVEVATYFPERLQKHFDFEIDAIGIDIGIDQSGKLWFFEVNTSPGPKFYETEIGEAKAQHYEYIIKNKLKSGKVEKVALG
ncbi:YheC/YheD family protein [Salipaludibacillus sp. CUR1]|uniref:YheC/YheD family protein n=1 Tax=Salipaludibacillus sp. CUR1 TaxID=2820003 RepID=UPI001E33C986|nr:YheC/YheD family protein [Salipaludibacillus sp. CUR1]MCE7792383.1 YheC/YheD family protein [Salipaludibacillus sp. CUR1]